MCSCCWWDNVLPEMRRQLERLNAECLESRGAGVSALAQGKAEILQYKLAMLKQLKPSTIIGRGKALEAVNRAVNQRGARASILNAAAVTDWLTQVQLKQNRKYKLVQDLKSFYTWKTICWEPPVIKRERTESFLPRLTDIALLISSVTSFKLAVFLQLLKETGMRAGEAWALAWDDIDFSNRLVSVRVPEKSGRQRTLRVSQRLVDMLNVLSRSSTFVFHKVCNDEWKTLKALESFRRTFECQRKRVAKIHPESNIAKIHFHSFRTWRATMEYLKTRDLERVMVALGTTNPTHARGYVRLAHALQMREDDYVTARATTPDEVEELAREGFTFVSEIGGVQVFRKERWLVEDSFTTDHESGRVNSRDLGLNEVK